MTARKNNVSIWRPVLYKISEEQQRAMESMMRTSDLGSRPLRAVTLGEDSQP
jgi:hypothetical protein